MAGGAASQGLSAKLAELAGGKVGWRGLLGSKKTFGIALFASLGGLVYGCKLARHPFSTATHTVRQPGNVRPDPHDAIVHQCGKSDKIFLSFSFNCITSPS